MLLGIAIVLVAASLASALLLSSRAPAVSLALVGGMAGGLCGLYFSSRHDPKGVPADVAIWATCGLVALGLVGLLVRPRGPARFLRRAAAGVILIAPLAAVSLAAVLLEACPLYVTDHAGYCFHEIDVLGGWISQVVALFVIDAAVVTVLLLVSAKEIRSPAPGTITRMSGSAASEERNTAVAFRPAGRDVSAEHGKSDELRGELARRRHPPRHRWWQFWRRDRRSSD